MTTAVNMEELEEFMGARPPALRVPPVAGSRGPLTTWAQLPDERFTNDATDHPRREDS